MALTFLTGDVKYVKTQCRSRGQGFPENHAGCPSDRSKADRENNPLGLVNVTLQRYLRLLETVFFIHILPAWSSNLGKRLTRSPKIHVCDTAVMAQLLDIDEMRLKSDSSLFGQFLESFVFAELMKQKSWSSIRCQLFHFRDLDTEIDFIIERTDGSIVGLEIKSSKQINASDLKGLLYLKEHFPNFRYGVIFYLGKKIQFLGEKLVALPLEHLWH